MNVFDQTGISQHRIQIPLGIIETSCVDRDEGSVDPRVDLIGVEDQDLIQFERREIVFAGITNPRRERGSCGDDSWGSTSVFIP